MADSAVDHRGRARVTTGSEASERLSAYHIVLLLLLGIATLYEGFDAYGPYPSQFVLEAGPAG